MKTFYCDWRCRSRYLWIHRLARCLAWYAILSFFSVWTYYSLSRWWGSDYHPERRFTPTGCTSCPLCTRYLWIRVFCKARLSSRWCKRISESYGMGDALAENVQQVLTENEFTVDVVIPASKRYLNQIMYWICIDLRYIAGRSIEPRTEACITRRMNEHHRK